jgi:hypothetical protein
LPCWLAGWLAGWLTGYGKDKGKNEDQQQGRAGQGRANNIIRSEGLRRIVLFMNI